MTGLRDPETLRTDPDVEFRERERVVDGPAFEAVSGRTADGSGLVVAGVTDRDGTLLLLDSEHVDGWTLPNGPVGVGEDWAVAADRWCEDALGFPVDVDAPELVVRTVTRPESGDDELVGYSVAFSALLPREPRADESEPSESTGQLSDDSLPEEGTSSVAEEVAERAGMEWFSEPPANAAPGHDSLIEFFLG